MTNNDLARYPVITDNCVTCHRPARGQPDCLNHNGQLEHLDCHRWEGSAFFFTLGLDYAPVLARDLGRAREHIDRLVMFWRRAEKTWPRDAPAVVRSSWARMAQFREHVERRRLVQAIKNF